MKSPFFPIAVCLCWISLDASFLRGDYVRDLQKQAAEQKKAEWGHWGVKKDEYTHWSNHSNRLVPIYTFGIKLDEYMGKASIYRDERMLRRIYGRVPKETFNEDAIYMDQTDVYRLQVQALIARKKNIILMVFDGMDWQTTQAASIYVNQDVAYESGRGRGLTFQDFRSVETDFGFHVSSPHNNGTDFDVNAQTVKNPGGEKSGGYSAKIGGETPWQKSSDPNYLLGQKKDLPHVVTDSAASATSMTSGIKTYNAAINVDPEGYQVEPLPRRLQKQGFSIGIVTSVPISHATPACAYANNVSRNDYQDLTRDLVGLPSISHRREPLSGVDVLIGCGWGEIKDVEADVKNEYDGQGDNYVMGNKFLTDRDRKLIDVEQGGRYRIAERTADRPGKEVLFEAARKAVSEQTRLLGFFGVQGGHLPYQTADGRYDPYKKRYSEADIIENPKLEDMAQAALDVLSENENGFWLMIEAGDVDWANHGNNIDDAIGSVLGGDAAFKRVSQWVTDNSAWEDTVVIVTADHGHYFVLDKPEALIKQ